jgi:hypothetical protein
VSWGLYRGGFVPPFGTLAQLSLRRLRALPLRRFVKPLTTFMQQAQDGTLPTYSFIEPNYLGDASDDLEKYLEELRRRAATPLEPPYAPS